MVFSKKLKIELSIFPSSQKFTKVWSQYLEDLERYHTAPLRCSAGVVQNGPLSASEVAGVLTPCLRAMLHVLLTIQMTTSSSNGWR